MARAKAKAKAKGKEVAVKKDADMVLSEERPEWMRPTEDAPSRGSEDVERTDLVIPRVEIVQALSPCLKKSDAAYIEGAEQGMLYNSVTRELYGRMVMFIPIVFHKEFLLWKKRTEGGGFRGAYSTIPEAREALAALEEDAEDFDIVETPQNFGYIATRQGLQEAVVSMPKSKQKVSRQWNSMIRLNGGDRWSRAYMLSTVEDSSDKGDYWNLSVAPSGYVPEDVYKRAEALYNSILAGDRVLEADRSEDAASVDEDSDY